MMKRIGWLLLACLIAASGCKDDADSTAQDDSNSGTETDTGGSSSPGNGTGDDGNDGSDDGSDDGSGDAGTDTDEAPNEGDWGVVLEAEYFALIKGAGFDAVRIPIRWSTHAGESPPYEIDTGFLDRVDWAVAQARSQDLVAVINVHHYEEIMEAPTAHKDRLLALWDQIAEHYRAEPVDELMFELLNEPNANLTPEIWNEMLAEVIDVVRETNPTRTLVVGTAEWGGIGGIDSLEIPEEERNVIVTVHYYEPFQFTHQGAEWVDGSDAWLGTTWDGTPEQKQAVDDDLDHALAWAEAQDRPIFVGEFGAYSRADIDSRARWTEYVARQSEARGFSWAYWEFCSGFGIYDPSTGQWNQPLLDALIP
jgi:endoglucanase